MSKKKIIITIFSIIAVVSAAIFGIFLVIPESIPTKKKEITNGPTNEESVSLLLQDDDIQTTLPDKMLGVWFDMGVDITSSGTDAQILYNEITDDFAYFTNFNPNTLIIKPDTDGTTDGFYNYDGSEFDALSTTLSIASSNDYFKVLAVDDSIILDGSKYSTKKIREILNSYDFNAVLICSESLSASEKLLDFITELDQVSENYQNIYLGLELYSLNFKGTLYSNESSALVSGRIDFAMINADCKTTDETTFTDIMSDWNNVAAQLSDISFYCLHRNDKVYTGINGWNDYLEICYQYKELWDIKNIKGSCFYKLSELKDKSASTQRLSSLIYDGQTDNFTVKQMTVSQKDENVEFKGVYDTDRGLYCNNAAIKCNKGIFEVLYDLDIGINNFYFENAGQYYTYRIYNNHQYIYDASFAYTDNTLNIISVCPQNSTVYCVIGGKVFTMNQSKALSNPEQYAEYSIVFDADSFKFTNAEIDIVCSYNGKKFRGNLGTVDFLSENSTGNLCASEKPTPYVDNGLGTAIMCEVYYDNTEQLGILNSYDTYDPNKSTLVSGTLDYVNQINLTDDGNIRYELRSGVAVYAENCTLINNAFVMPDNNISVFKTDDSQSSSTDMYFSYDWLSPITITTGPNDYKTGYQNFSYNIDEYNAEYVDIKFAYTDSITNEALLTFAENSVVASAEVLSDSDNESTTLRLHLKNKGGFYGYTIRAEGDNTICISLKKHSDKSLTGKVVMLDPGHGGLSMTGTAVANQSICESEVTLSVALKVRQLLTNMGATVIMTRTNDTSLTLSDRVKMCEEENPDIFVSLHCDGTSDTSEAGTHTFYYKPYSQPLANAIHNKLVHHYKTYIYTDADTNIEIVNKNTKYYPFFVTRVDTCPSVLVEMGFMSNVVESSVLTDDNCQYWLADAIANGISDYFANN